MDFVLSTFPYLSLLSIARVVAQYDMAIFVFLFVCLFLFAQLIAATRYKLFGPTKSLINIHANYKGS